MTSGHAVRPVLTLETERLLLRPFRDTDIEPYAAMCADPDVMRYVGDRGVLSRDDAWRQMAMLAGHWHLRGFGMWALEERATGVFIGRVGSTFLTAGPTGRSHGRSPAPTGAKASPSKPPALRSLMPSSLFDGSEPSVSLIPPTVVPRAWQSVWANTSRER